MSQEKNHAVRLATGLAGPLNDKRFGLDGNNVRRFVVPQFVWLSIRVPTLRSRYVPETQTPKQWPANCAAYPFSDANRRQCGLQWLMIWPKPLQFSSHYSEAMRVVATCEVTWVLVPVLLLLWLVSTRRAQEGERTARGRRGKEGIEFLIQFLPRLNSIL